MANHHAGNLGDLWKHLPLAALLEHARPDAWWESHAGSATYPPAASPGQDFGVRWYRAQAPGHPVLAGAAYTRLLQATEEVPGSAAVAMACLGGDARYLLCDLDPGSLASLQRHAARLGLPAERLRCVQGDGLAALDQADLGPGRTFALLDPFEPEARLDGGPDALALFDRLADRGVSVALWYAFFGARLAPKPQRAARHAALARLRPRAGRFWAEVALDRLDEAAVSPGLQGCGLLFANLSPAEHAEVAALGQALVEIYQTATLEDGGPGRLELRCGDGCPG